MGFRWRHRRSYRAPLTLAALVGLTACADSDLSRPIEPLASRVASQPTSRGGPLERFPEMLDVIPAVRLGDAGAVRQAELSDDELIAAVARAGGKVLIGFKPTAARRVRETGVVPAITRSEALGARAAVQALGAEITMTYRYTSTVAATISPELAPRLRRLAVVDHVQPALPGILTQLPSPQDTSWGVKKVRAHLVWGSIGGQSTRGEMANVTILDTGLDYDHLWGGTGDGPASTYGDCYWTVTPTITSCYDNLTNDAIRGHGPHVAGVVAGADNEYGFIGIANNPARLSSVRVCDNNGCLPENVLAGLNWALGSGLSRHIVNVSIGYCTNYVDIQQAVAQLQNSGALVIAAAGNVVPGLTQSQVCGTDQPNHLPDWATSVMFPARYPEVMAVSGTYEADQFAAPYSPSSFPPGGWGPPECTDADECQVQSASCLNGSGSRSGPEVDIAAPFKSSSMTQNGLYSERCGTSFSAPVVAGVAALVWSRNPSWTAAQVRQRLESTAVPYSPASQFGAGRVDAYNAVYVPPPTYSASISGPDEVQPGATCSFSASSSSPHGPHSYEWEVNGSPVGYSGSYIYHTAGSSSFTLSVTITDGLGGEATAFHSVDVSGSAPECFDQ